jgi:hypothetical protein
VGKTSVIDINFCFSLDLKCEKSYQDIATKLMIPLKRTILVTDGVVLSKGVQRVVDHLDIPHLVSDSGGEEDDLFTDITASMIHRKLLSHIFLLNFLLNFPLGRNTWLQRFFGRITSIFWTLPDQIF